MVMDRIYQQTPPNVQLANALAAIAALQAYNTPKVWVSGADLVLGIGQSANITATAATSIPLHIACGDGQVYEIDIDGSFILAAASTASYLAPNNTTYANAFAHLYTTSNYTAATVTLGGVTETFFSLDTGLGTSIQNGSCIIFTSTANKKGHGFSKGGTTTDECGSQFAVRWNDTTTVWSSLGTVIMPNAWTGTVVVRRIA